MIQLNSKPSKTYLFSIAIGDYTYLDKLPNATKDAREIIKVLLKKYKIEDVWQLEDGQVNSNSIRETFIKIKKKIKPEDSLLIIYNGHGAIKGRGEKAYWQFQSSKKDLENTWYKCSDFFDEMTELDIEHIALLVNSCFSGNLFHQDGFNTNKYDRGLGKKSRVLLTAGLKNQLTLDKYSYTENNSPFCSALIEILSNNKDQYELFLLNIVSYIHSKFDKKNYGSTPRYGTFKGNEGGQFILYLKEDIEVIWKQTLELNTIEAYDSFMQKFKEGALVKEAEKLKSQLVEERSKWSEALNEINNIINKFIDKKNSPIILTQSEKILKQIKDLKTKLNKSVETNNEWEELMKVNNSSKNHYEKIKALEEFISNNRKSDYNSLANDILANLKNKVEEESLWKDINNRTGKSPINIKRGFIEYIYKYKYGLYIGEANQKLRDISLYIEAKELVDNKHDLAEGRKLLEEYKKKFPEGLYLKKVEKELNKVSIEAQAKKIKLEFEEAKRENNLHVLYDLVDQIKGFNEDEQEANKEVFVEAQKMIKEYEEMRSTQYERAIQSNRAIDLKFFIEQYSNDQLANTLVEEIKELLYNKEEKMFYNAESEKTIDSFHLYKNEFEEGDNFYDKVIDRIKELEFYFSLNEKQQYKEYIDLYKDNGLMLKEAKDHINRIEFDELKQSKYETALRSESIALCQQYLDDYEEYKDENWYEIESKFKKLDYVIRAQKLFEEIIQAKDIKEKLGLCNSYITKYKDSGNIEEVRQIQLNIQDDLDCDEAFEIALKEMSIEVLENYKVNYSKNHDKADDFIEYLHAKSLNTKKAYEAYINKYQKEGLNTLKAKDAIEYLDVLSYNKIEPIYNYLRTSTEKEFSKEANERIRELEALKELEEEFQKAKDEHAIENYSRYLRLYGEKNKEYRDIIIEELSKLKREKQDNEEFKAAKESGKAQPLADYIGKYGESGLNIIEATKLFRERNLGITEKDINVLQKMDENSLAIRSLGEELRNMKKSTQRIFYVILLILVTAMIIILLRIYFI